MTKKIRLQEKISYFSKSIDLALFSLQIFDFYSYNYFFQQLKENDPSNQLIISLTKLRFQNKTDFFLKNNDEKKVNIKKDISNEDIKKILIILSKVLNSKFCKQKLELICFYFLPEYNLFKSRSKVNFIRKSIFFNFWIKSNKKRFNFFFKKKIKKIYIRKIYTSILIFYLQNGLRYLNFYKNL